MVKLEGWGLDGKFQSELYCLLHLIRSDNDLETRRKSIRHFFGMVGHWIRREMTSLLDLALWKFAMGRIPKSRTRSKFRSSCLVLSGANVIIKNVAGYLWGEDEPRAYTTLQLFPGWCMIKDHGGGEMLPHGDDFDSDYDNASFTDSEFSFDSSVTENMNDLSEGLAQMV